FGRLLGEKPVGDLGQDAGAVAGVVLGPGRAAVLEVDQELDALRDDVVGTFPLDVHHEPDAAGIVLKTWVVQSFRAGKQGLHHRPPLSIRKNQTENASRNSKTSLRTTSLKQFE